MSKFPYQIGILGDYGSHIDAVEATFIKRFDELGFSSANFRILRGKEVDGRQASSPFAAIFFGYDGAASVQHPELFSVIAESSVVLPIVDSLNSFSNKVPPELKHINGIERSSNDPNFEAAASVILENFRLLRRDRRLFISYKRSDSEAIALQLYESLDRHGFDVFLDTNGVPPGKDFQSVLWHRLADSDVVVLLDTPHFFDSRWTEEELARAIASNIQILHVLWPGQAPHARSALNHYFFLNNSDFESAARSRDMRLKDLVVEAVATEAESLRARAIAFRHRYLVDAFCDEARRCGLSVSVQPTRHIVFDGKNGKVVVVPMVGVPSALRLHDVDIELASSSKKSGSVWALYDDSGLLDDFLIHLDWLNSSLPLQSVKVLDVAARISRER